MNIATGAILRNDYSTSENFRDFLIAAIRCGRLRAQLLQNEIDEIGVALKSDLITPEAALSWLRDIGAFQFLDVGLANENYCR